MEVVGVVYVQFALSHISVIFEIVPSVVIVPYEGKNIVFAVAVGDNYARHHINIIVMQSDAIV